VGPFTETRTHIWLDGYIAGHPMRRKISFDFQVAKIESAVSAEELFPGDTRGYGSKIIMALLSPNIAPQLQIEADKYFGSYRHRCRTANTLQQAIDTTLATIQAHCDPEALTIDRRTCEAVGGHIHAATITPQRGFEWVPGFEPATP
jgi:hypothetical protein